jgi:dipeptidyl aminopeptidase/acylaminoacyl peptidase
MFPILIRRYDIHRMTLSHPMNEKFLFSHKTKNNTMNTLRIYVLTLLTLFTFSLQAQDNLTYQVPPKAIEDLVRAPQTPAVSINATGDWMVLLQRPGYPSIEELSQPELKIAGIRINPRTNGSSRSSSYNGLVFKNIQNNEQITVTGLPENPRIENVNWSPNGQKIAFTHTVQEGIELWTADLASGTAAKLTEPIINDALGGLPYRWLSDQSLMYKAIPEDREEKPAEPLAPAGPVIQEATGVKAPVRTYQDLLKNPYDEALFEYYTTAQMMILDLGSGSSVNFGSPGIFSQVSPSPDGQYIFITQVVKPFSYIVPYYRFTQTADIYDLQGNPVKNIAKIPAAENIPKGFGAVRTGPRNFTWRADVPATLYWVEAQDEGDPNKEVDIRDKTFFIAAPFTENPTSDISFKLRAGGVTWGSDDLAIAYEWWWTTREMITSRFVPGMEDSKEVIFERSFEDRYNDPGDFETRQNKYGEQVLLTDKSGKKLYLTGTGASPEGNRPFVREFDLAKKETNELWRSEAPYYEYPVRILDLKKNLVLTRRESKEEPPNYYLRDMKKDKLIQLTGFSHPYLQLKGIEKQVVQYKRNDGLDLKGDLYLPTGFTPGEDDPLPVILWAYPEEFKSADAAGQVQGSPYEFLRLGWWSPLYFITQGYAIFDDPSMPVVGEGDEEPNDSFREQLVENGRAAIQKLEEMGVGDPDRVAIGGHSYGAFMTANLLAHSDLFAAGIARSGAYNRTLTPFGFQSEERTYWDAPEVYYTMSPFMHADKIDEPMLMIHGEADNNSGTFPLQSERMFAAMKGLGGTARLVMLPHESHGYRAQESILHMLWEMNEWLEKYVKNENGNAPE